MRSVHTLPFSHEEIFGGEAGLHVPYHRMYGKQYCVPALTVYTKTEMQELRTAAEAIDVIYCKVMRFVQRYLPDSFLIQQLGLHPALVPVVRQEMITGGITRQDWIIGEAGLKCIENNTDTPTGIPEAAALEPFLTELAAGVGLSSPSVAMDEYIRACFRMWLEAYAQQGLQGPVTFTSFGGHLEDRTNTEYLMQRCREAGFDVRYAPLEELEIIPGDALYHEGYKINLLYRLYPLEYLVDDRDERTGVDIGVALLELVQGGRLGLMNPGQHVLMQSKGFMATIWSLYERNEQTPEYCGFRLFQDEELKVISRYLLPTYFEAGPFELQSIPYVAKSYWGREGRGTVLFEGVVNRELSPIEDEDKDEDEELMAYYHQQPKIYQELAPMQEARIETEEGPYWGYLLTGVFVIGGRFAGVLPRIGEKVTGDMAYYCAASVMDGEQEEKE
ncbi:putative acid--amine ligase YjfC [compost metagenome]